MKSTLHRNNTPAPAPLGDAAPPHGGTQDGLHVAIIMDGNGRWASRRGLPRLAGHRAGVAALREVVEHAPRLGISTLTVYAFSADNWKRPAPEVSALMSILADYLQNDLRQLVDAGVRLTAIGRRDRLPDSVVHHLAHSERVSAEGTRLALRVALDYSARDAIVAAARSCASEGVTREALEHLLGGEAGDVDLLIRTSGEQRLSDFLLWECAYAEMVFTPRLWPDFGAEDLQSAVVEFHARDRRYGGVIEPPSTASRSASPMIEPPRHLPRWPAMKPRRPLGSTA